MSAERYYTVYMASAKEKWTRLKTKLAENTIEIMRRTGKSKTCVWRWQARFAEEGVDRLLRDKTRPSRIPPLGPEVAERVVDPARPTDEEGAARHHDPRLQAPRYEIPIASSPP